jgi:hypothetical protein
MSKIISTIMEEIREAIPPMIFFLIVFHIITFTRHLMEMSYGITVADSAVATVGALIVSKAILIAGKLQFVKRFEAKPMLYNVLWKALIFSLFTFLFRLIEELIPLFSKYGSLGRAGSHLFEEIVWPQFWAIQIWLYMSLVLYCSAVELIRILGKDRVKEIFFGRKK